MDLFRRQEPLAQMSEKTAMETEGFGLADRGSEGHEELNDVVAETGVAAAPLRDELMEGKVVRSKARKPGILPGNPVSSLTCGN